VTKSCWLTKTLACRWRGTETKEARSQVAACLGALGRARKLNVGAPLSLPESSLILTPFVYNIFCAKNQIGVLGCCLSRVMRAAVSIPSVAAASVSHSAAVGGSVVGVVGLL